MSFLGNIPDQAEVGLGISAAGIANPEEHRVIESDVPGGGGWHMYSEVRIFAMPYRVQH